MFRTIIGFIKIVSYMLGKNKLLRQARKCEKAGDFAGRDKIVRDCVPDWARFVIETAGGTVEVAGIENIPQDRAVVFIGNHQSYMDIPLLLGYTGKHTAFVAKAELGRIPVLAPWMRLMPCTFIERKSIKKSMEAIRQAAENVRKGYSQMIFPEGTRSRGGAWHEFKAGSFKLAFNSGAPIVPVTIDGTYHLYEETGRLRPGHVRLTVHPPIETAHLTREQKAALPAQVQDIITRALPAAPAE